MQLLAFTLAYGAGVAAFLFVMLCGEAAMFADTPVAWMHWAITTAPCTAFEWAVVTACGGRGERWLVATSAALCERRNPALQIAYVAIVAVMYWLYARDVFAMLPQRHFPAWHTYTGTGALLLCLAAFLAASFSDPGFVTAANVAAHCAATPYDDATNTRKTCSTCRRVRPARSKHCSACGGCVARLDHHCAWLNTCVGFNNMRYFLLFLAANLLLTAYGSGLAVALVLDELASRRMWSRQLVNYRTGQVVVMGADWGIAAQWIIANYGPQVTMAIMLAACAAMMAAFLGYHLWLLRAGMTTNETYKWRDLRLALGEQLAADGTDGSADRSRDVASQELRSFWRLLPFKRRRPRRRMAAADQMPPWQYSNGFGRNLWEVMFPHQWLAARTAGKDLAAALAEPAAADADVHEHPQDDSAQDAAQNGMQIGDGGGGAPEGPLKAKSTHDSAAKQVNRRRVRKVV